jgi:DNA polymerase-1
VADVAHAAMSDPLLVVDAPSLLFRAFYALPDSITDKEGQPVNALLGTTNLILLELERRPARAVVLCFGEEAATYRTDLYDGYHARTRPSRWVGSSPRPRSSSTRSAGPR